MQMVILGESPLSYSTFSKSGKLQFMKFVSAAQWFLSSRLNAYSTTLFYYIILLHFQFITLYVCYTVFTNTTDVLKKCLFCVLVSRLPELIMQRRG